MNFPRDEFAQRYARLQSELERIGADALLVTSEANFTYFTGFVVAHPWVSYSRNLLAILPREGAPVLIVPAFLAEEARAQSWIDRVYPSTAVGAAPVETIVVALDNLSLHDARIGAELGYEQRLGISVVDYERLKAALPDATFVDAAEAIWALRTIKSPAETACLRRACDVMDDAFQELFRRWTPGMSERDIARALAQHLLAAGADRVAWIMMTSGRGQYGRTFGVPRDRVPAQGDMVWLDVSAVVNGYGADYDRAGVIDGPTQEQQALQQIAHEATLAGIAVIKPGVPIRAVAAAVDAALLAAGLEALVPGRIGHGLGLQSTEPPDVSLTDPTILAPGMVITVEPAIVREDGIYQVEQNIAVTATGHEMLSTTSHELRTI